MKPSSRPRRTDRREAEQVGDSTSDLLHLGKEVVTDASQFVPRFLSSFVQRSPPVSGCPSALPRAHVEVKAFQRPGSGPGPPALGQFEFLFCAGLSTQGPHTDPDPPPAPPAAPRPALETQGLLLHRVHVVRAALQLVHDGPGPGHAE